MDETTTPPAGPSPDGIFAEARRIGSAIATASLAMDNDFDAIGQIQLPGGVLVSFWPDRPVITSDGKAGEDITPEQVTRMAGLLAGVADAYRLKKEPRQ